MNGETTSVGDSCDTVPLTFFKSLHGAGIDNLLQYLGKKSDTELRLRPNQQRGDPYLTSNQKLALLRTQLEKSPGSFLFQFGKYLTPGHLQCFESIRSQHYDVDYYLVQMESSTSATRTMQIKNRRYEALQKLVDTTDYFTEEEMQRRNPILFSQLIGRYHSKEEREAFLQLANTSTSARNVDPELRPTPLTDMLMAHMSRGDGICSDRRISQEMQVEEEKQAEHKFPYCNGSNHEDEGMVSDGDQDEEMDNDEEEDKVPEIDESEKDLLKEEFFTTMYRHFLEGKDPDFPYDTVDDNADYDIGETLDQDQEEKYFEAEHEDDVSSNSVMSPQQANGDTEGSEEDELDAYMKGIDAEVERQNRFIS